MILRDWLAVGSLVLCLAPTSPAAGAEADSAGRNHGGYTVAGVSLGMDFNSALKIYPAAVIERTVPTCYSHGQAISMPARTRRTLRHHDRAGTLTLDFEPASAGGRLSRIHYDRGVDPSGAGVRKLLDRLLAEYGSYDQILHRRKMEPAGRIVGFEWRNADGATLRVVLRKEFENNSDGIRLSILARSAARTARPMRRTLPQSCG